MDTKNGYSIESRDGNTEISIDEGDGTIRIQHFDQGSVELDALTIDIKGGTVNIEAGSGEDDSINATISTAWATALTAAGAGFSHGDIKVPITSHPNIKINGKPAITK